MTDEVRFSFEIRKHHTDEQLRSASRTIFNRMIESSEEEVIEFVETFINADHWYIEVAEVHSLRRTVMFREGMTVFIAQAEVRIIKKECEA